tara:strand:+ start:1024 stop:1401 length:378 start_codon:yes stop_codon:yes gene_type:complete
MLIQRRLKDSHSNKRHPDEELEDYRKMLELLIVEKSGTNHEEMAWTYETAFIISAYHGDHERASLFAERAYLSSVLPRIRQPNVTEATELHERSTALPTLRNRPVMGDQQFSLFWYSKRFGSAHL